MINIDYAKEQAIKNKKELDYQKEVKIKNSKRLKRYEAKIDKRIKRAIKKGETSIFVPFGIFNTLFKMEMLDVLSNKYEEEGYTCYVYGWLSDEQGGIELKWKTKNDSKDFILDEFTNIGPSKTVVTPNFILLEKNFISNDVYHSIEFSYQDKLWHSYRNVDISEGFNEKHLMEIEPAELYVNIFGEKVRGDMTYNMLVNNEPPKEYTIG